MPAPTTPGWRLLRSATFAVVATQLAALGHVVGGGGSPDLAVLLIGAATVGGICAPLADRRRTWGGIFAVMVACQLAFHLLFSVDVHAMANGHSMMPADPGRMLVFHVVAAALSALLLAKGDSALFGLFSALRRSLALIIRPLPVESAPTWTVSFAAVTAARPSGALLSTSPRRGPPAGRA